MEVLNPIYMAPNMTALTKMTILNIHFAFFYLMKHDGVNRMFPFAKRDSEWVQGMSQKIINCGVLIRFLSNPHV